MLKRLWANFKKDWIRGQRHFYLLITLATTIIYILFIRFVLPPNYTEPVLYQYNATSEVFEQEGENIQEVSSKAALYEAMREDSNSYGVVLEEIDSELSITIIMQSEADEEFGNLVKMLLNNEFYYAYFGSETLDNYDVEVLHPEMQDIPFRDNYMPILIVMDSAMIGMFLLAVMLFIEKDQKMHTAYMVSPGGLTEHLLSKVLVTLVLSLISAFTFTLVLRGFDANYLYLLIMMIPSAFFGSSLGLFLGAAFKNIQKSMGGLITIMLFLALPVISYAVPSFRPEWITYLPTYFMIYGVRSAIIPVYGFDIVWQYALITLGYGVLLYMLSQYMYRQALYKNG